MSGNLLNMVSFLSRDWELTHLRPHHEGLGKYARVLCIEPPITIDTPFRKPGVFWEWVRGKRNLRQLSESLWLYKPVAVVPYAIAHRFPFLRAGNRLVMRASIGKVLKRLAMRDVVVMLISPMQEYVMGMLEERILCYEVNIDYEEAFTISAVARRTIVNAEENILRKADIVFTFARSMFEKRRKLNPNTFFVPTAADIEFFMKALDPATALPADLQPIGKPRIGLIGHIDELHTDIELLNYLAERHPEWSIIVIGAINTSARFKRSPAFMKWQRLPNIHYLGRKDYETLPYYLKGLDVCLLPYKINRYTDSLFPTKLFQYLAGGKPVVSTGIPEMKPYREIIAIAADYAEFERLVEEALAEQSPERIAQRIAFARENSVEKRGKEKIDLIEPLFDAKVAGGRK